MTDFSIFCSISDGLNELRQTFSDAQKQQLHQYIKLLDKWNSAYNLTAVTQLEDMVPYHLLDSLSVLKYLNGRRVLDIGTGAGLPGIPLAIAQPNKHFVLLDSNGKKTRFVQQVTLELGLTNVEIVKSRIEDYSADVVFDTVISRAFASFVNWLNRCLPLVSTGSHLLLMQGKAPKTELLIFDQSVVKLHNIIQLNVPGLAAERHLISLECI